MSNSWNYRERPKIVFSIDEVIGTQADKQINFPRYESFSEWCTSEFVDMPVSDGICVHSLEWTVQAPCVLTRDAFAMVVELRNVLDTEAAADVFRLNVKGNQPIEDKDRLSVAVADIYLATDPAMSHDRSEAQREATLEDARSLLSEVVSDAGVTELRYWIAKLASAKIGPVSRKVETLREVVYGVPDKFGCVGLCAEVSLLNELTLSKEFRPEAERAKRRFSYLRSWHNFYFLH